MSSQQKFYLSFSLLVLFLGYASFIGMSYKKEQLSQQVITDVPVLSSSGNTSSTGIALSASGSHQSGSVSPSSTGTTIKFKKPNTEWKSRTLSGITYIFGEGNPKEVALEDKDLKSCSYQESQDFCTDGAGYVTDEIESLLLQVLNDPNWELLLTHCEGDLRNIDTVQSQQSIYSDIQYDTLINGDLLDINNLLITNPGTGRKELKKGAQGYLSEIYFLRQYLMSGTWTYNNGGLGDIQPEYSKCIDTYGKTIINQLTNIYGLYMNPRNFIYPQS